MGIKKQFENNRFFPLKGVSNKIVQCTYYEVSESGFPLC